MRVLVVEDDHVLADGITIALQQAGYAVDRLDNGRDADHVLSTTDYDAVVLDLSLPGMDGTQVLTNVRQRNNPLPILVLTARDTLDDRVSGLNLGADDYMTKPFDLPELEARIRALIRRANASTAPCLSYGQIQLDTLAKRVSIAGTPVDLSAREIGLLEILLLRAGRVVSKEQLAEHLYNWDTDVSDNAIEVYVHRLRKKLEHGGFELKTIRGLGYLLEAEGA